MVGKVIQIRYSKYKFMADKPTRRLSCKAPQYKAQVTGGMGFNDEEVQIKVNRHAPTVLRPSVPETSKAAPKEAFQVPTGLSQGQASTGGVHRSERGAVAARAMMKLLTPE